MERAVKERGRKGMEKKEGKRTKKGMKTEGK